MTSEGFIITPNKVSISMPELAGGKGTNLAELVKAGLFVPNWYCISTAFMEDVFDSRELFKKIDEYCIDLCKETDPKFVEERVAAIQSTIMSLDFTDEQVQMITTGHDKYFESKNIFLFVHLLWMRIGVEHHLQDCMTVFFTSRGTKALLNI
jgi:phosphoenolpyruvate synthase/pyruvate phosphate dikinase